MAYPTFCAYPIDERQYVNVATIAGSDPSGGAGVQADLKTFASLQCYGTSIITTLTAQNTCGVSSIHSLPSAFVGQQLASVFNDIRIDAIKLGMLEREEIIVEVARSLEGIGTEKLPPLVVDPVIYAKSGDQIINDNAINTLKEKIVPLATLLTPNCQEACRLLGREKIGADELENAAKELLKLGPKAVIIKGVDARDCLVLRGQEHPIWFGTATDWIDTKNVHGTGCTFSAAITSFLGRGDSLLASIQKAKIYTTEAIRAGSHYELGKGNGPVCHHWLSLKYDFVQKAWLSVSGIYEEIKKLPFLNELANGSLPREKFNYYIEQDYLFLLERKTVCDSLLSRLADQTNDLQSILTRIADNSELGAKGIFMKYEVKKKDDEQYHKSLVCTRYTDYMKDLTIKDKHIALGVVVLLPCTLIYQKVGEEMKKRQRTATLSTVNQYYQLWIDTYSSDTRRQSVEKFVAIVNQLVSSISSPEKIEELLKIFRQAAEYERDFWIDAYNCV